MPAPGGRLHAYVGGEEGVEYTRQSRTIAEAWGGTWESLPGLHHFSIVEELRNPGSAMVAKALSAGGREPMEAKDYGFMYQRGFQDLDGHLWEIAHMDGEPG